MEGAAAIVSLRTPDCARARHDRARHGAFRKRNVTAKPVFDPPAVATDAVDPADLSMETGIEKKACPKQGRLFVTHIRCGRRAGDRTRTGDVQLGKLSPWCF